MRRWDGSRQAILPGPLDIVPAATPRLVSAGFEYSSAAVHRAFLAIPDISSNSCCPCAHEGEHLVPRRDRMAFLIVYTISMTRCAFKKIE